MSTPPTQLQVAGVVSFYMVSALVMVFVNKATLNGSPEVPLLFLFIQVCIAVVLLHVSAAISPKIDLPKPDLAVARKLVPLIAISSIGLVFNTLCLRDVDASFFQIARGLVLPFTILVSSMVTRSSPGGMVILSALIVTGGFFVGVARTADIPLESIPSTLSLFYGVLSSVFIALHAVLIKSSLPHCNNSSIQLAWWTNIGSAVALAPFVILTGEGSKILELIATPSWNGRLFVGGGLITGFFGFLLSIAGVLSIKVTSPITHMFSSAARSVLQTLLGVWIFGDILTVNRATSILVILLGTMYYTWIKATGPTAPKAAKPVDLEAMGKSKAEEESTLVWNAEEEEKSGSK